MSGVWQQPIARVQRDGVVIGTGAVIRTEQDGFVLLTCAHVVNEFLNRSEYAEERPGDDEKITFTLPVKSAGKLYAATLLEWFPPSVGLERTEYPVSDIALLKILDPLPGDMRTLRPESFKVVDLAGKSVAGFGYSDDNGVFAGGELLGMDAGGWLNFKATDALQTFIQPGFSGAPLLDENRNIIVGMVVALNEREGRVAYAQPAENLWCACPQVARPYKGLRDFEEVDALFFFGRDRFIDELFEKSRECPIVGVSALSGAGKSSIVKAGLIPKLRINGECVILKMRPGSNPWKALARELAACAYPEKTEVERLGHQEEIQAKLASTDPSKASEALRDYVRALLAHNGFAHKVLIYVDQFEELFTLAGHTNARDRPQLDTSVHADNKPTKSRPDFRDLMANTATLEGEARIQWCYSIRADFTGKLIPHRAFIDRLGDGEVKLSEMVPHELRMAIRRPAKELNVTFEVHDEKGDLVNRLADDAGKSAGSLPLLEHVLEQLWGRMSGREISHTAYDALGGLGGALDTYAEEVAKKHFPGEKRQILRRLFFRLVEPGDRSDATRRIVSREELDDEDLWGAAVKLTDARLVIIRGGDGQPDTAEVAHEALIDHWTTLRDWISENRGFLKWAKAFRVDYDRWTTDKRSNRYLLKGGALVDASRRIKDWASFLNKDETNFIQESEAAKTLEDVDKQKQQGRIRNLAFTLAGVFAVVAVASVFGLLEFNKRAEYAQKQELIAQTERQRAEEQAALAKTQRIRAEQEKAAAVAAREQADVEKSIYATAIADRLVEQGKLVPALLILRDVLPREMNDYDKRRKEIALNGLAGTYQIMHEVPSVLRGHRSSLILAAFSPDGARIVTASSDDTARLWDAQTGREVAILKGHENSVYHAAFSPDGARIVTASSDDTARLWDAQTGRELAILRGHENSVYHAAFSPDGARIVTASSDDTARLWDAQTGRELAILKGHENSVYHAAFSPDGARIVTASRDDTARLWDAQTGRELAILRGHENSVNHAAFSPDGARIVTASSDDTARLWDTQTGRELAILKGHESSVDHAAFSPDGARIVTASWDDTARLWDAQTGRELAILRGHENSVNHAAFSPDGARIVTASDDRTARLWDAQTGRELAILKGHEYGVNHAAFSPDGVRIVTASSDDTARLWDTQTGREVAILKGHEHLVNHAAFSPDGARIVTASRDDTARLWDAQTGRELAILRGHENGVNHAAFSPDGARIVTASRDDTARLWDAQTGRELAILKGHENGVNHAAFSPDGARIVTASRDDTTRLWDAQTGRELAILRGHEHFVNHAAFSPDGVRIVTASSDDTARLWDTQTGRELAIFKGHENSVYHAAFSPDGARIVTASWDDTARLWDAQTGRELAILRGHENSVNHAAFSPDGVRIVTASDDRTVRLWDAQTGREVAILKGHEHFVYHAAFSPDGARIVTASSDGTARLWDAQTGRELAILKGHENSVYHAAFSLNGARIVTASSDDTARLWNVVPMSEGGEGRDSVVSVPISQSLLDIVHTRYPYQLSCDERREILKDETCP
ncbi:nSTAND1 domain-containing NTPase [Roseibium sp. M-1]